MAKFKQKFSKTYFFALQIVLQFSFFSISYKHFECWSRHLSISSQFLTSSTRNSQKRLFFAIASSKLCFKPLTKHFSLSCKYVENFIFFTKLHKFKQNCSKSLFYALKNVLYGNLEFCEQPHFSSQFLTTLYNSSRIAQKRLLFALKIMLYWLCIFRFSVNMLNAEADIRNFLTTSYELAQLQQICISSMLFLH